VVHDDCDGTEFTVETRLTATVTVHEDGTVTTSDPSVADYSESHLICTDCGKEFDTSNLDENRAALEAALAAL
jgi:Fe2+ or Zn2+ uptake regulation protein